MSQITYACPLCDEYMPERDLPHHLIHAHAPAEIASQLAYIVVSNGKDDLLELLEQ